MPIPRVPPWIGDLDHLNGLNEAALATDADGQIIFANVAARRLYQFLGADFSRMGFAVGLLPESEHAAFGEILGQVLAGTHWAGRLDVRRVDGSVRTADVSCSPLRRDGTVAGTVCIVDDSVTEGGHGREERRLGDRVARLARIAAELATAEEVSTVTKVVTSQAADAVGATVASMSLVVEGGMLALAGLRGGREGAARRWSTYPISANTPAGEVARTGEILVLVGEDAIQARYPDLERAAPGERSMLGLPLRVMGRTVGVITLSFPGRRDLDAAELEFLGMLADSCAQALERIRAQEEATAQAARVHFLADASTELSKSLDYERTLANVARLAVPTFADWCAIDVVEDDRLHRLAVEHVDPLKIRLALEIEERYPSDRNAPGGAWEVVRTGRSTLIPEITEDMLAAAQLEPDHLRMIRLLELRSVLLVPLVVRDKVFGVISWVMAESDRRYTESDLAFAEDLGRRGAVAIDNAQLHSQTREVAERLQRAVQPEVTIDVPGWELASFYSPAGRTEVGGDFYDAIALPEDRLTFYVGDVMGRGLVAAAAMAQMRAAIRAYVAVDPTPDVVFRELDRMFVMYGLSQLVTLVCLVVDPREQTLTVLNAGHPPPVILRRDGKVEQLPYAGGPPLGLSSTAREPARISFEPGDTLLAFTDGLIERRGEDIEQGQRRLCEAVPNLGSLTLQEALPDLVDGVRDHTREDDIAVLAARWLLQEQLQGATDDG